MICITIRWTQFLFSVFNIKVVFDLEILKINYVASSYLIVVFRVQSLYWSQISILTHYFALELWRGLMAFVFQCVHINISGRLNKSANGSILLLFGLS